MHTTRAAVHTTRANAPATWAQLRTSQAGAPISRANAPATGEAKHMARAHAPLTREQHRKDETRSFRLRVPVKETLIRTISSAWRGPGRTCCPSP